jgi:tRNA threonylcarbamoyladenosine biosynthesis protein TsaE
MEVISTSTETTEKLAQRLASSLRSGDVLALYGDLGSGKTTFTRFLVEALGITARVQSPTFIIARKYKSAAGFGSLSVNHVDLYRLQNKADVLDIGLPEMFEEHNFITVIEWPELAEELLPKSVKKLYFEYVDENTRKIQSPD